MKKWVCAIVFACLCTACATQDASQQHKGNITMYGVIDQGVAVIN